MVLFSGIAHSQEALIEEEVIVTGIRGSIDEYPGVTFTKKGDYLLLKLLISNDTREEEVRKKKYTKRYKTL